MNGPGAQDPDSRAAGGLIDRCPACGRPLSLDDQRALATRDPSDRLSLDQFARALCGCYVLDMPEDGLNRLLASILGADPLD